MTFDDMKKIETWGLALMASVALHAVVLGALLCSRGCGSSGVPELPPAPVTEEGRATDLPETRARTGAAKQALQKVAPTPAKSSPKVESRKSAQPKVEPRKPQVKEARPVKALEPSKEVRPAKDVQPAVGTGAWKAYKVRPGDSLTKLSKQCGCTVQELARANGLAPTANLLLGQTIRIKSAASDAE